MAPAIVERAPGRVSPLLRLCSPHPCARRVLDQPYPSLLAHLPRHFANSCCRDTILVGTTGFLVRFTTIASLEKHGAFRQPAVDEQNFHASLSKPPSQGESRKLLNPLLSSAPAESRYPHAPAPAHRPVEWKTPLNVLQLPSHKVCSAPPNHPRGSKCAALARCAGTKAVK